MDAFTHARHLNQQTDSEAERKRGAVQTFGRRESVPRRNSLDRMGWRMSAELARVRKELDGQRTRTDTVLDRSYVENGDFLSQFGAQIQARLNLSEQVDGLMQA
jgi:hypothetical protein